MASAPIVAWAVSYIRVSREMQLGAIALVF